MKNNAVVYVVGAVVFILLIWISVGIIEVTDSGDSSIVGIIALIIFFTVFPIIAINAGFFAKGKISKMKENISVQRNMHETATKVKKELNSYENYKHSYKHCSDVFLANSYEELKEKKVEDLEVLAIEEEMVRRGLLDHSPMHQKLILIKREFKI